MAELDAEFSSVVLSPGETETITIGEGMVDFVVGPTSTVDSLLAPGGGASTLTLTTRNDPDQYNETIDVMDDSVTEITVENGSSFSGAIISGVTFR